MNDIYKTYHNPEKEQCTKRHAVYLPALGEYAYPCEDDLVCKCTTEKIPHFNAPLYLENKQQIGKVDEIFGPIRDFVSLTILNEFSRLSKYDL